MSSYVEDVGGLLLEYTRYEDAVECIGGDLAERGAEEMRRQFAEAEGFFRSLAEGTEHVSYAIYILAGDAQSRAAEARKRLEKHAAGEGAGLSVSDR